MGFMVLYKEGNFDSYASSKLASSDVFEELPIKVCACLVVVPSTMISW